jgi:hypothetical protein
MFARFCKMEQIYIFVSLASLTIFLNLIFSIPHFLPLFAFPAYFNAIVSQFFLDYLHFEQFYQF